jgi:hypothetical protein
MPRADNIVYSDNVRCPIRHGERGNGEIKPPLVGDENACRSSAWTPKCLQDLQYTSLSRVVFLYRGSGILLSSSVT